MSQVGSETVPADEDASGMKNQKRMSDEDFAAAKELYELGKANVSELARDFNVHRMTMSKRLKAAGAKKGSRAQEAVEAEKRALERYAARRADWIEETRLAGYKALTQARLLLQKTVTDHYRSVAPGMTATPAVIDDDLKALQRYNKALLDNVQGVLAILDAANYEDEQELPVLHIEDLTAEEILNHHITTGVLPENATIEDLNTEVFDG